MKKRFTTLTMLLLVASLSALATAPTGYYKSIEGKSGKDLKDAIQTLIAPHTVHSYNSLWYYFYETDAISGNPNGLQVWDMYSNNEYFFGVRGNSVSGMNKEHSFPKNWWGGYTEKNGYDAYTDLNHLMPSDAEANNRKSNWPLGEVAGTPAYNNGVTKVGSPKSGQGGGASRVFEPDDEYKGDFARVYFYMATIYQDYHWNTTWQVSNQDASGNENWKTLTPWSIDLLLKWAREDTVSAKEIARNDAVFRCQNNRNPFIDDPLLFEYIWGNRAGQAYDPTHGGEINPDPDPNPNEPELITPTQGTLLDFGEIKLGESTTRTLYVKGLNMTSNLTLRLYKYNYMMFSIPTTSIDYMMVCTDEGYPLEVTYTPTSLGEHQAKLLLSDGGMTGSVGVEIKARCVEKPMDEIIGDLNGDGVVDVADVNICINIILELTQDEELENLADINYDGVVDVSDVNMLINIILEQ